MDLKQGLMTVGAVAALVAAGTAQAQTQVNVQGDSVNTVTSQVSVQRELVNKNLPDADMQALLNAYASLKPKPIEKLSVKEARKQPTMADAVKKLVKDRGGSMPTTGDVEHDSESYKTTTGENIKMDVYYTELKRDAAKALRPVILYFHGGGWVLADNKAYESSILALARKTGAVVFAADYRHAPESRFPSAHDDAFAAYQWVLKNAKEYKGDASRIAVVGESAGGNLAANVGIMARDKNTVRPVALGLIYPVAGTDMGTPSYVQNEFAKPLNKAMMAWFVNQMVRPESKVSALRDPRLDLMRANVAGLPSTTVITAGIDPLRSEGEAFAAKLKDAGVPTVYRNFDGVTHEFFGADVVVGDAAEAQDMLAAQLNSAFTRK